MRKNWIGKSIEEIHNHRIWMSRPGFRIIAIWVYDNDVEVHASVDYGVGWRLKIILLYEYDKSMKTLVLKNIINPIHGD